MFRCSGPRSTGRQSDFNLVNERLNAGHFAWTTASDKFLEALVSKIRPVDRTRQVRTPIKAGETFKSEDPRSAGVIAFIHHLRSFRSRVGHRQPGMLAWNGLRGS